MLSMLEPEQYPQNFYEMVELVLAGQKDAAGIIWDGTMQRMTEDVAADPSTFCPGKND